MATQLPAVSLAAVPGRRSRILEMAQEIERRGFPGIFCPSLSDNLALCEAIALCTNTVEIGTSITPIYTRNINDFAQTAGFIHEVSGGRFKFGIGVSHEPAMKRMGVTQGKPLGDIRNFVENLRAVPRAGDMPPIVLATLRDRMIALAEEIGQGMVFANGARSHMGHSLSQLSDNARADDNFFIGNMIPTCISDDEEAAKAVNRRTLTGYAALPNYRNYWKEAGYVEEMEGVEAALAERDMGKAAACLSDRWLADTTLFGTPARVREGIEAWFDAGIKTPIIVPSSAQGNQMNALEEFFDLWD
jgi:alkanesulfonate monooxygenase SsuD/methylene tetrahydromethanopterin reductase-like flavin-dependent oxidoreductase (luciferase family)